MSSNSPVIADSEVERAIDELVARQRGGEQVVIPGKANELGTVSSASHKAFGADALTPEEGKNRAMFKTWDDPSRHMNTQYRDYMLAKSLKDAGYPFACPWDNMGEFLQDGWRAKQAGRRDEFTARHASTFKGMRDMGGFFKARGLSSTVG
jgi:hypothetical protein